MSIDVNHPFQQIQALKSSLKRPASRAAKIDTLVELAWALRMSQPKQACELATQAVQLSQSDEVYTPGVAGGLVVQAFVETFSGELDTAVVKVMQALALVEANPDSEVAINAWYTLSWNSFFLGDFPIAMDNALKVLRKSQELGLKAQEAWALDAIASCHGATHDFSQALEAGQSAVAIFRQLNDVVAEARVLNNLAYTLSLMGNQMAALAEATKCLELALRWNIGSESVAVRCTLGQILIEMGQYQQAEFHLRESLIALANHQDSAKVIQVTILLEWGRLYRLQNKLELAEDYLLQALALAQRDNRLAEEALCHKSLSEIYESRSELTKALEHYKSFHRVHETALGDQAAKRLMVFKIIYQVETAQRETEIYRLQTIQLQHEVEQQRQLQEILSRHSTEDGLTGLSNRRHFDAKLGQEYVRLSQLPAELSIILLDVDCFKAYNDTYGHVQGDDCLRQVAQIVQSVVNRSSDIVARYGGEEFACILPETSLEGATYIAERIRQEIVELAIAHSGSAVAKVVTASFGVATAWCRANGSAMEIVAKADQQLYTAKSAGRNRIAAATV